MQLDPATVIFAFLAIFVLWKLRSVLGERSGFEQSPDAFAPPPPPPPRAAEPDWAELIDGQGARAGIDELIRIQPSFTPRAFLDGARAAYEMVVTAFARGDEATLKSLASEDVFGSFSGAIAERARQGETMETTLVGMNQTKIIGAGVDRTIGHVVVRFDSQFIMATRDRNGAVVEGDPTKPTNIVDVWTFARPNSASGPNWTLVATSPQG